jgi:cytochrome c-type biogenesis protein CcmH/NrfG
MKKEHLILVVFLGIIVVAGAVIFLAQSSRVVPPETEGFGMPDQAGEQSQMPSGPDTTRIRSQIVGLQGQLEQNPESFEILAGLGNAHYDIGDPASAIEYYERALKIRPNSPGVIVDLGAMYRQKGDPDKAIEMFRKAIELDPQLPQAYFNLGMVLRMEKQDAKGAATAWKKYLELDPNSQAREFLQSEIAKAEMN